MDNTILIGLVSILIVGVGAQWLAWRINLPSILILLLAGILVGPVFDWIHPDALLGHLLLPIVSISVAVILFEGGLALKRNDLQGGQSVIRNLITIGAVITWFLSAFFAYILLDMEFRLAVLFGGILVVTGPTVIIPLLRFIHPKPRLGSILKWEGILIDPIGALLVLLIYDVILQTSIHDATQIVLLGITKTITLGLLCGILGGWILYLVLNRYWVPDFLHNPLTLMMVVTVFMVSDLIQHESGLFAVTIMGIFLANQSKVDIKHIIEFKEDLVVLLISCLFVILAARIHPPDLWRATLTGFPFLLLSIFLIRPLSVLFSTLTSDLNWKERGFLAWMAPRGIVAAAVASVFALRLEEAGVNQAEWLVPYTFMMIIGTVLIYGLSAKPVGQWLQVAQSNPQGILFLGAFPWVCQMAKGLQQSGFNVFITDKNRHNIYHARLEGLPTFYGNVFTGYLALEGIGRLLAMTPNEEVNSLSALHFETVFGRAEVYQLMTAEDKKNDSSLPKHLRGRLLFGENITYDTFQTLYFQGWIVKKTKLTKEFTYENFKQYYGENAIPLFILRENKTLLIFTTEHSIQPEEGDEIISYVNET